MIVTLGLYNTRARGTVRIVHVVSEEDRDQAAAEAVMTPYRFYIGYYTHNLVADSWAEDGSWMPSKDPHSCDLVSRIEG